MCVVLCPVRSRLFSCFDTLAILCGPPAGYTLHCATLTTTIVLTLLLIDLVSWNTQTPLGELTALPQTLYLYLRGPLLSGRRGRERGRERERGKEKSREWKGRWLVEQGLTSHSTQFRSFRRRCFYRSDDPTNSVKELKEGG